MPWSLHTSLFDSLDPQHGQYLESAVKAGVLGHLEEARHIFNNVLPESHTVPAIALERLSLLQIMGLEADCADLCRRALREFERDNTEESSISHLFSLNIGLAEFHTEGKLPAALDRARSFRKWLNQVPQNSYLSTHISCIVVYYRILYFGREVSNYVEDAELLLLDGKDHLSASETLADIREHLQHGNRFAEAWLLVRPEGLFNEHSPFDCWYRWLLGAQESFLRSGSVDLPTLALIVQARLEFAADLLDANKVSDAQVQLDAAASQMKLAGLLLQKGDVRSENASIFPRLSLRLDMVKNKMPKADPLRVTVDAYIALAHRAHSLSLRRLERLCLMGAVKVTDTNRRQHAIQDLEELEAARFLHSTLVNQLIEFESCGTGEALYISLSLSRMGGHLVTRSRSRAAEYIKTLEMFFERYVNFDAPSLTHNLYWTAISAARQIGDTAAAERFQAIVAHSTAKSAAQQRLDPELQIYLEDQDFFRNFRATLLFEGTAQGLVDYEKERRRSISVLIAAWVERESELGLLTTLERGKLLAKEHLPSTELTYSKKSTLASAQHLKEQLFAFPRPTEDALWDPWWDNVQDWLNRTDLWKSITIRQALVVKIQAYRTDSVANYLGKCFGNDEFKQFLIRAITEFRRLIAILEAANDLRSTFENGMHIVADLDTLIDVKFRYGNMYQMLANQPNANSEGLITDTALEEIMQICHDCCEYYKREGRLESVIQTSNILAQCCWHRHLLFDSVPVTSTFQFTKDAENTYRQIRMENFVLEGSRAFVARETLAGRLQMNIWTAFAIRNSLRALVQKVSSIGNIPPQFTQIQLAENLTWWTQRSKAQGLTDMLGLDSRLPLSILPNELREPNAHRLLQEQKRLLTELKRASAATRGTIREQLDHVREEMRREPSLEHVRNLQEGFSVSSQDIRAMSASMGSDVVFVDWVYVLYLDAWDIALVTYRNGAISGLRALPIKLKDVERWTEEQLIFDAPLKQRRSTRFLHRLDGLVAELASLTKPNDTLVFCPTKILHRVPLHALKIGGQVAIERNPIVYCQSLSVLRLCQMSIENALDGLGTPSGACVFTPVSDTDMPGLENELSDIVSTLDAKFTPSSRSSKEVFLEDISQSSLIHFHGHCQLSDVSPLRQHLDFSGHALPEDEKSEQDMLTTNEIFDLKLKRPAHVTIMGCSSGRARISDCDDLLGLVTAFHYAGASSVISALWPIDSRDGLEFSRVFYARLKADGEASDTAKTVNLARAMQAAVLALRTSDGGKIREPYHWAGLVFNGAWLFPKLMGHGRSGTEEHTTPEEHSTPEIHSSARSEVPSSPITECEFVGSSPTSDRRDGVNVRELIKSWLCICARNRAVSQKL